MVICKGLKLEAGGMISPTCLPWCEGNSA